MRTPASDSDIPCTHGSLVPTMNFESILGAAVALALLVYLTYTLLRPEKF
jgi:K+-transporting ATPase KdpF subunit